MAVYKKRNHDYVPEDYYITTSYGKMDNWKFILDKQFSKINCDYIKENIITDGFIKEFFNMYSTSTDYERLKDLAKMEVISSINERFRNKCYKECKSYFSEFSSSLRRKSIPYSYEEIVRKNLKKILLKFLKENGTKFYNGYAINKIKN